MGPVEIIETNPLLKQGPRWSRKASRWVLNISRRGESISPLGILFQGSITLNMNKFLCILVWNFLHSSLWLFPLYPQTVEKRLSLSL